MLLPPLYDTGCPFVCQIRQWFRSEGKLWDVLTMYPTLPTTVSIHAWL